MVQIEPAGADVPGPIGRVALQAALVGGNAATLIDEVAGRLGYKPTDYIAKSYLTLYQDHLKLRGLPLKDMLFDAP